MTPRVRWTLIAIGVAAAVTARLLSAWALGSAPHVMDELTYYLQARTYASGHWMAPERLPHAAFNLWFVEDRGRTFGIFPPGWPLLLALGLRLKCELWVNPILHGLATVLVGRAGARLGGGRLGIVAALLYGASPQAVVLAASAMPHTLVAFLAAVVLNACIEMATPDSPRWWIAGGSALGFAAMTRPLCAVVLAVQFAVCWVVSAHRRESRLWPILARVILPAMAGGIFLLWYNDHLTGSPWTFPQTEYFDTHLPPVNQPSFRYGPGCNALGFGHACEFVGASGVHDLQNALHDTAANLRAWLDLSCAGFLMPPLVLLGLWAALRRHRHVLALFVSVPAVIALYALYWHGGTTYGARYYHAALPTLVLTAALGISEVAGWLREGRQRSYALTSLVLICLVLDARALAAVGQEMSPSYFGVDDRFAKLQREWSGPPALVMVAYRDDPHPLLASYPMTTGGLLHDFAWIGAVRVLGATGANTPDLSGPVVFAKYHPGLVPQLRRQFPQRALWLYVVEPQGSDTLVPYDRSGLTNIEDESRPPADNFGVFWLPAG